MDRKEILIKIGSNVFGWEPYYDKGNVWYENPEWYDQKGNFKILDDVIDSLQILIDDK